MENKIKEIQLYFTGKLLLWNFEYIKTELWWLIKICIDKKYFFTLNINWIWASQMADWDSNSQFMNLELSLDTQILLQKKFLEKFDFLKEVQKEKDLKEFDRIRKLYKLKF